MLENKSNVIIASILLFLAALFWSGNFIVGKIAGLNEIPPISLNILRWSLAFLILLPFTYKEMFEKKELIFKNFYLLCFLGITAVSIFNSALFYSFGHHHLGWTLGAISGKIISKMISGENTNLDLQPYSSIRFS